MLPFLRQWWEISHKHQMHRQILHQWWWTMF